MISSDVLEHQFGETFIEVLHQKENTRIICTKSKATNQILELSWVTFKDQGVKEYPKVHQAVKSGLSMGKAFRNEGIEFKRADQACFKSKLPATLANKLSTDQPATVNIVSIEVGLNKTPYAAITELYHPDVLWPVKADSPTKQHLEILDNFAEIYKATT